jgi:formylglycine-generating enzyme required for sulfatase activity/serine/threonine protein kinase
MNDQDPSVLGVGTRIDQYVIVEVLGRGGFGITYHVYDEALAKDFALKEFFPEDLVVRQGSGVQFRGKRDSESDYRWSLRKFYDEARLLAQFSHPNIVSVRRVFQANNSAYMLLDFVEGSTLEKWLSALSGPPSQEKLDLVCSQLLGALELVHANRAYHLDISPDNIMIRADGVPILLDFGASRFEIKQHSRLVSALVVKQGYSAPEQYAASASQYGPWTDIYAFAGTLYRAVAGRRPLESTLRQLRDSQTPAANIGLGRYRDRFLAAIDWGLKLPPQDRPQSVGEWRTRLEERPAPAPTRVSTGRSAMSRVSQSPVAVPVGEPSAGRRGSIMLLGGVAVAALLLGSAGTYLAMPWLTQPAGEQRAMSRPPISPGNTRPARCEGVTVAAGPQGGSSCAAPGAGRTAWFKDCDTCPEMVVVPAGAFMMGSPEAEEARAADEGPQRRLMLAKPFALARFEVTFEEWDACAGAGGCRHKADDWGWGRQKRPVIDVSWTDAGEYAAWLSKSTGKSYRLPTEAEWEYAARAGTTTPFWWGSMAATHRANYDGTYTLGVASAGEYRERTTAVGTFEPNPWGLHDMHGNVGEWVEDCYAPNYAAKAAGPSCARIVRGGSWTSHPRAVRAAYRTRADGGQRSASTGFRVARSLD